MEYYDPMEMKCPWCRRPSRPGFGGPGGPPPRPGYGPPPRPGFGPPPPPPPGPGPGSPGRPRSCTRCIRPFETEKRIGEPLDQAAKTDIWKASDQEADITVRKFPETEIQAEYGQSEISEIQSRQAPVTETQPQWEQPGQPPATQPRDTLFQEDEPSTPLTRYYEDDYETERDLERMKSLYPEISKELFPWIEDACDQMEYEGSLMFDEYPDRLMLERVVDRIYQNMKKRKHLSRQNSTGEDRIRHHRRHQEGRGHHRRRHLHWAERIRCTA